MKKLISRIVMILLFIIAIAMLFWRIVDFDYYRNKELSNLDYLLTFLPFTFIGIIIIIYFFTVITDEKSKLRIQKNFGSMHVFIVYFISCFITLTTLAASIIIFFLAEKYTLEKLLSHGILCVLSLGLFNVPILMQSKFKFDVPDFLQIIAIVFIISHFVVGEIYRFYDYVFLFDKTLHITAGIVIVVCGFSIVYSFNNQDNNYLHMSPFFVAMFSFCFSITLLVLWEFFEYFFDLFANTNMQRWVDGLAVNEYGNLLTEFVGGKEYYLTFEAKGSGLTDTMEDLVVGAIGALVISILGGIWIKKYPSETKYYIKRQKMDELSEISPGSV